MSEDPFSLLGQPCRPWIDPEDLRTRFLELSTPVHPDRVHQAGPDVRAAATERYATLNAAWKCLSETKSRLGLILAQENGRRPEEVHEIPSATADLFLAVSAMCQRSDEFLARRSETRSPLIQATMFAQTAAWMQEIRDLLTNLQARRAEVEATLPALNVAWESAPARGLVGRAETLPLTQIEEAWRALSYLNRWCHQLQERLVQLHS